MGTPSLVIAKVTATARFLGCHAGAYIRCHLSRLDASAYILDARTDTVTMTRSLICMHAPKMAKINDYVIVTILYFLCKWLYMVIHSKKRIVTMTQSFAIKLSCMPADERM